jgi:hypothetical protein
MAADQPTDTLSTLQDLLAAAARIASDLSQDTLLPRLIDVFARMPAEDRETIVQILEREVDLRNLAKDAASTALGGPHAARVNPNARLYLRTADGEPPPYVKPEELVHAVIRAARVVHRAAGRGRDFRALWGPSIVDGLTRLDADERDSLRKYHRTMLELLDEAGSEDVPPADAPPEDVPH